MIVQLYLIKIVIIGLWSISAVVDYTEFCYLWQLKEYRLDRLRDFFSTKQGQQFWLRYALLWRSLLALFLFMWPINNQRSLFLILLGGFTIDVLRAVYRLVLHKIRLPKPTAKAALIVAGSLAAEGLLALSSDDWGVIFVLLIIRFPIQSAVVLITNKITILIKEWYIRRATEKIASYPQLTVVGITGSYGKSSVKEYLSHILSQKFQVIKTPGNTNTDIGVAKFILHSDFDHKEIFVVEMGAYKIGEIKKICDIVKPKIGILTAIIEQHIALFGSIENIQTAKWELLRAIPTDGLVVTNADNPYCTAFISELGCQNIVTFGDEPEKKPTVLVEEVTTEDRGISATLRMREQTITIKAPVVGAHQILNIAPAIAAADFLQVTNQQIIAGCATLPASKNSLKMYQFGTATIIDDSYNSNPKGFRAALEILGSFSSKRPRIVITRGMLELGEYSQEIHETLAEEIAFYADTLIIITPDAADFFEQGAARLKDTYRLSVQRYFEPEKLQAYLRELQKTDSVILIENRLPASVYHLIKPL